MRGYAISICYLYIYILISYIIYKRGCRCLIFNWNNWNWNIHDLHFSSTRLMSLRAIMATFKDSVRSLQALSGWNFGADTNLSVSRPLPKGNGAERSDGYVQHRGNGH